MRCSWKIIRWIGYVLLTWHMAYGQQSQVFVQSLTTDQGIPTDILYDLAQTPEGLLLAGTDKGVFEFNGIRWKLRSIVNSKSNGFTNLLIDSQHRIWCRNFAEQIFYEDNDSLKAFTAFEPLRQKESIVDLKSDQTGVYIVTQGGIFVVDSNQNIQIRVQHKQIDGFELHQGHMYWVDVYGKMHWMDESHQRKQANLPFGEARIVSFGKQLLVFNKKIWDGIIYYWTGVDFRVWLTIPIGSARHITNISTDLEYLGVHTTQGAFVIDRRKKVHTLDAGIFASDGVTDREGNYWVSTIDKGLLKIPSFDMRYLESPLKDERIRVITGMQGAILLGSVNGKVVKMDGAGTIQTLFDTRTERALEFIQVSPDGQDLYTSVGKFILSNGQFTPFYYGKGVAFDEFGTLFFGIHNQSGCIPGNREPECLQLQHLERLEIAGRSFYQLRKERTRAIVYDSIQHVLYIAYADGLLAYQQGRIYKLTDARGEPIYAVSLGLTHDGLLVAATMQQGVLVYSDLKLQYHFTEQNGLSSVNCGQLSVFDNRAYVITDQGIDILNITSKQVQSVTSAFRVHQLRYTDVHAVDSGVFAVANRGVLFFPVIGNHDSIFPFLKITSLHTGRRIITDFSEPLLLLSSPEHTVEFYWDLYAYERGPFTPVFYRLLPLDTVWREIRAEQESVLFNVLSPGAYEFEIKAGGEWAPVRRVRFEIAPPFWRTGWFIICLFLGGIGLVYLIFKLIFRQIQRRHQIKEQMIGSQLTALRSQMNPHFLYNVLNSLQGMIYTQKINEAGTYLSKFSEHLRNILKQSEAPYSTLRDELQSVSLYLELEKLRFGDDFKYYVDMDESVDDQIQIPTMIIQPFLENAIKHGLLHKKGEKNLWLRVKAEVSHFLRIEIEDNGIGRAAAEALNALRKDKPPSFATRAIEDRVALLNAQRKHKIQLTIHDLTQPVGTRVIILIPIDYA